MHLGFSAHPKTPLILEAETVSHDLRNKRYNTKFLALV